MTDKPDSRRDIACTYCKGRGCKACSARFLPDEKPTVEKWADKLAADSVAAGEAEYGPDYKPTTGLTDSLPPQEVLSGAHWINITVRINGEDRVYEADYLKNARRIEAVVRADYEPHKQLREKAEASIRRAEDVIHGTCCESARKDERERAAKIASRHDKCLNPDECGCEAIHDAILRGEE
jgi:hypothetical protein